MAFFSRHPDDLYKNGIQRSSFIPAIELLKSHFEVTDLDSGTGTSLSFVAPVIRLTLPQTTAASPAPSPKSTSTLSLRRTSAKWRRSLSL